MALIKSYNCVRPRAPFIRVKQQWKEDGIEGRTWILELDISDSDSDNNSLLSHLISMTPSFSSVK